LLKKIICQKGGGHLARRPLVNFASLRPNSDQKVQDDKKGQYKTLMRWRSRKKS